VEKILLTGFEPFEKEPINPSQELLKSFDISKQTRDIHTLLLPVTVRDAGRIVEEAIEEIEPDYLISFGLNGKLSHIALERVALNIIDARIPDNNGEQPQDTPICENAPVAYWSTLPLRDIERELKACGIPVKLSYSAGTYICNFLMYTALNFINQKDLKTKAGFIHIPFLPEQCTNHPERSSMDMSVLHKMLKVVLSSIISQ